MAVEHKLVYIEWEDSAGDGSHWRELDYIKQDRPARIRSVGWLLAETENSKTIVAHLSGSNHGQGEMTIPKSAIKKFRVLKAPDTNR